MKNLKSIFFAAVAALFTLTSCGDDDYTYVVGSKASGAYLVAEKSTYVFTPGQEQVLTLKVARTEDAAAEEVTLSGDNDKFQVPASIAFSAGEKEKVLQIPFSMETGESEKLNLKITSTTSEYASGSLSLTVNCDYNWESLGLGTFTDAFFMDGTYDVEIMQNVDIPTMFRVIKPYDGPIEEEDYPSDFVLNGKQCEYIEFRLLSAGDELEGVTLTLDNLVYFSQAETGFNYPDLESDIVILHPSGSNKLRTELDYSFNKVEAYQEDGTPGIVQLAPRYQMVQDGRGWNYNQENNMIVITFPGFSPKDYTMDFTYSGRMTDLFGTTDYVQGVVTLGADIAAVRLAIASDETYDDVLAGLQDGTVEGMLVEKSGQVQVPTDLTTGHYYMLMVGLDGDGNVVATNDSDPARFFYTSSKEQWEVVGTGLYTYGADVYADLEEYSMSFYEGSETATLYKSTTTDGLYTIKPWGNAEANYGLVFWWDTETNELVVDGAETGDEDIYEYEGETYNDGPVVFYTLDMLGFSDYKSAYDPATTTFTFSGSYVSDEGWYGGVKETFVLNGSASARPMKARAQKVRQGKTHATPMSVKCALSPSKAMKIVK